MSNKNLNSMTFPGLSDQYVVNQIAETFGTSTDYSAGDYCNYLGQVYRFTADHDAGTWDGSDVEAVYVADDLKTSVENITELEDLVYDSTKIEWTAVSGGLNVNNGGTTSSTARIRTDGYKLFPALVGDYMYIADGWAIKVFVHSAQSITAANFVALLTEDWLEGPARFYIPEAYCMVENANVQYYISWMCEKIGSEDSDISSYVDTITNYVAYCRPSFSWTSKMLSVIRAACSTETIDWGMYLNNDYATGWGTGYFTNENVWTSSNYYISYYGYLAGSDTTRDPSAYADALIITPPSGFWVLIRAFDADNAMSIQYRTCDTIVISVNHALGYRITVGKFGGGLAEDYLTDEFLESIVVERIYTKAGDAMRNYSHLMLHARNRSGSSDATVGFLHYTDLHGDISSLNCVSKMADTLQKHGLVTDVLNGGDLFRTYNGFAVDGVLVDPYDETASYSAGDFCTYTSLPIYMYLWKCTAATTGTFDASCWTMIDSEYNSEDFLERYNDCGLAEKSLLAVGNHEYIVKNYNTSTETITDAYTGRTAANLYDDFLSSYIGDWGVTYTSDLLYYYKDYASANLRLIVVDPNFWDSTEATWFEATLLSAYNAGYSVAVLSHCLPSNMTGDISTGFTSYESPSINDFNYGSCGSYTTGAAIPYITAFQNYGGEFVAWFCGHNHIDRFGYDTDTGDVLIVSTTCATKLKGTNPPALRRDGFDGTTAFNLITIDTTNKLLELIRVGENRDIYLRETEVLCYDYANRKFISGSNSEARLPYSSMAAVATMSPVDAHIFPAFVENLEVGSGASNARKITIWGNKFYSEGNTALTGTTAREVIMTNPTPRAEYRIIADNPPDYYLSDFRSLNISLESSGNELYLKVNAVGANGSSSPMQIVLITYDTNGKIYYIPTPITPAGSASLRTRIFKLQSDFVTNGNIGILLRFRKPVDSIFCELSFEMSSSANYPYTYDFSSDTMTDSGLTVSDFT